MPSGSRMETMNQTFDYLEKVVTTTVAVDVEGVTDSVLELGNMLFERKSDREKVPLHAFELKTLANLVTDPDTKPDEILYWVPSLARSEEDELTKVIDYIVKAKSKVGDAFA